MEKRRRARINASLSILKSLIVKEDKEGGGTSSSQSRLEKADILELTVSHLRQLEREREELLERERQRQNKFKEEEQQQQQQQDVEKRSGCSSSGGVQHDRIDSDVKSYQIGYQACCDDISRWSTDELNLDSTKDRLIEHIRQQKEKMLLLQRSDNGDVNVISTRLPDGRFALIFSSPCAAWLATTADHPLHSNQVPATPPSSPSAQQQQQVAVASVSHHHHPHHEKISTTTTSSSVWRPWF